MQTLPLTMARLHQNEAVRNHLYYFPNSVLFFLIFGHRNQAFPTTHACQYYICYQCYSKSWILSVSLKIGSVFVFLGRSSSCSRGDWFFCSWGYPWPYRWHHKNAYTSSLIPFLMVDPNQKVFYFIRYPKSCTISLGYQDQYQSEREGSSWIESIPYSMFHARSWAIGQFCSYILFVL